MAGSALEPFNAFRERTRTARLNVGTPDARPTVFEPASSVSHVEVRPYLSRCAKVGLTRGTAIPLLISPLRDGCAMVPGRMFKRFGL
jgi:hypothetical protein